MLLDKAQCLFYPCLLPMSNGGDLEASRKAAQRCYGTCDGALLGYNVHMPSKRTETTPKPPVLNPMFLAIALALIGWAGVVYLVSNVHPTRPGKAAFLALWAVALAGTAWPVILALHRRFLGEPPVWTVWRQSAWAGIFGALAAWMQMNRVLNVSTAAILAGVFVVLEVILSWRARQESQHD